MNQVLNYNIHDLLKIRLEREKKFDLTRGDDVELSFFRTEMVEDPDIIYKVGKFKPSNDNSYIVDHKYHIKENYFYCEDSFDNLKWEIEIFGFEEGKTEVNFNYSFYDYKKLLCRFNFETVFLRALIFSKLNEKGYTMIHAGGVSKGNKGFVFPGRGGAFKTSIIMDLIKRFNFYYLGDDWVILNKNEVFNFPAHLLLFDYIYHNKNNESINFLDKLKFIRSYWFQRNTENVKYVQKSRLNQVIFIKRSNIDSISIKKKDKSQAISQLISSIQLEMMASPISILGFALGPYYNYLSAYAYIFPNSKSCNFWGSIKNNLEENLKTPIYEVEIPNKWDSNITNAIIDHLGNFL